MYRYVITLEEIDDPRTVRNILEDIGDTVARVNRSRNEVTIETSESIEEIYEALKEEGYEIVNLEMSN